jgi:hypothetical protein
MLRTQPSTPWASSGSDPAISSRGTFLSDAARSDEMKAAKEEPLINVSHKAIIYSALETRDLAQGALSHARTRGRYTIVGNMMRIRYTSHRARPYYNRATSPRPNDGRHPPYATPPGDQPKINLPQSRPARPCSCFFPAESYQFRRRGCALFHLPRDFN